MESDELVEFLAGIDFFSTFSHEELSELAARAEPSQHDFGDTILRAGEPGLGLYVIIKGTVRLFTEEQGKETSLGVRKSGEVFAELAALREHRLEYSVRASAKTQLVHFPRAALAPLLQRNPAAADYIARLTAISTAGGFVTRLFNLRGKVAPGELEEFIQSIGVKPVKAGQTILTQGSREDRRLYIVRQGKVQLKYQEADNEYPLATLQQGESFGEKACLLKQEQPASAVAETDTVLLVIPEQTINFILERNPAVVTVLEERIQFIERELQRQKKLAERRNRRILLDLFSKPGHGERIIRRFPLVEQAEEMDCGAACLAMICRHYHINLTLGKLRELANVTTEGATLESLARVGESLGFSTRGVQCTYQALLGFELPFIVHWEGYHYVVVYGISKHHVWVADPALGFRKLTVAEFERGWSGTCLIFTPGESLVQLAAGRSPWLRFIAYLQPFRKLLGYLFLATLVIEVLSLAPPIIMQNILDRVVVHQSVELLHVLIFGLIIAQVFTQLTVLMRALLANFLMRNLDFSMIAGFFKHCLALPVSFFTKRRTGDIFARFQENHKIRQFLTESTISTLLNLLMVFIYFTVLFIYNVQMTLLLIAMVVPIALLTVLVTPRLKHYAREAFEASTDAESVLMETLSGAETIKGMGIERAVRLKWERKYARSLDVQYRAGRFQAQIQLGGQLLSAATTIVVLWVGATLVLQQELSIGQLIAFNMLMGSVMAPLMGLVGLWDELHEAGIAMERLGDVLDLEPEQKPETLSSRILLPDLQGDIRLENVYFRYGGNETPYVLENISCEIKPGQLVAIVGQSGSGKTTLAKLLVGFYPPSEGRILVDGYDLGQIDMEYYRAQVGYVMQSNLVFSGTVAENIAIGDDNPDRRRIVEVAKMADAHGYISNLPLGYEQVVGERGVGLSGGQVQRLCIARALYHNPRLLIFDEATSALDTQSESNILGHMHEILKGRTAIVIAHRLSTVMNADKILVLYDGCITEQGGHQELLDQRGMYYQLVQKQLSGAALTQ
ncbi:peptidase domain-containing ABC transporter [Marinobacterium rhizophilum]|uniref:peptidase domain-containing ABC transporter n=1 Tax=Marinobacterium rhizophilum TaxID=420402 RepID=UPI00036C909F|nr:peptidase domain-containing ABC transporter [Marinobacterium rhizophilum]